MMILRKFYTDEQLLFAEEVRSWVRVNLDPKVREKVLCAAHIEFEELAAWWRALHSKGWAAPAFPERYGGTRWSSIECGIFETVLAEEGAPQKNVWATNMIGPVLIEFGTEEQRSEYLPRLLSVDDFWAQGFSEPGSGSDLASLRTKAEDNGDHWLVNGQKLWTTFAQYANKMFLLVRTDPNVKPQKGISMLCLDVASPGITVRPVVTIDHEHEVNEVFFDNVKVPKSQLIGRLNGGWDIAKFLLNNERVGIAQVGKQRRLLERVKRVATAASIGDDSGTLIQDRAFLRRIAAAESDLMGIEITSLRLLRQAQLTVEPSLLKLRSSQLEQELNAMAMEAGGPAALPGDREARRMPEDYTYIGNKYASSLLPEYCRSRSATIYGGTSEVQHNIISRYLGL